jgi:hypothetical protein
MASTLASYFDASVEGRPWLAGVLAAPQPPDAASNRRMCHSQGAAWPQNQVPIVNPDRSQRLANAEHRANRSELPIWLPGQDHKRGKNPSAETICVLTCGKATKPGSVLPWSIRETRKHSIGAADQRS